MPRLIAETSSGWGASQPADLERSAPWITPSAPDPAVRAPWNGAVAADATRATGWNGALPADIGDRVPWGDAQHVDAGAIRAPWVISACADREEVLGGAASPLVPKAAVYLVPWGISSIADAGQQIAGTGGIAARPAEIGQTSAWNKQQAADTLTWVPWGMGRVIDGGLIIIVEPGDPTDPGSSIIIPIRSTYIVINDVSLVRLPDNTPLQAYELSLQWNSDSWSVGWSATLPGSALDAVMPDSVGAPVELQATVNGTAIRLLAESIGRDRRFGDARLKVSGRGRVAWLASPYAATVSRTNDTLLTAQQLADAALAINGVPIGWGLDWKIADWNVPAGVWSHAGAHVEAVQRIADAAGGYVLGHRSDQTLHVRKRYPLLPWEWAAATPDIVIPAAVASTEAIAWTDKPSYNRVFISGEAGGILGDVKRAGTAGDLAAQMVTDSLITAEAAARARGGAILSDTGRQASISIQMPVLEETGILDLGQLVEYNDGTQAYRGLVRSVSVRAALPQVWQTVEIETHA